MITKKPYRQTANDSVGQLAMKILMNLCESGFRMQLNVVLTLMDRYYKNRALKFAKYLDVESLKASNGWLESFKNRDLISFLGQ